MTSHVKQKNLNHRFKSYIHSLDSYFDAIFVYSWDSSGNAMFVINRLRWIEFKHFMLKMTKYDTQTKEL